MKNYDQSFVRVTLTVCAVLASITISAGVIAFFAHNWDSFSKGVRIGLSFASVLAGIAVFYKAFFNHHDSKVWMESAGTFLVLMTGSSTALVAQIYHIGDFDSVLLCWMLISLPVLYLANSSSVTIVYLAGITWWLGLQNLAMYGAFGNVQAKPVETLGYWLLIAAVIPHFYKYMKPGLESVRMIILGWFSVVIILCGANMGFVVHYTIGYSLAIVLTYVLGKHIFYNGKNFWNRPLQTIGVFGTVVLSLFLSNNYFLYYVLINNNYKEFETGRRYGSDFDWTPDPDGISIALSYLLLAVFIFLIVWLVIKDMRGARRLNMTLVVFPLVVVIGIMLTIMQHQSPGIKMYWFYPSVENKYVLAKIWFNLYILVVGGHYLYNGAMKNINGSVSLGVTILSLLMAWRYFDMEINYILKAILYVAAGTALLLFNKYYSKHALNN